MRLQWSRPEGKRPRRSGGPCGWAPQLAQSLQRHVISIRRAGLPATLESKPLAAVTFGRYGIQATMKMNQASRNGRPSRGPGFWKEVGDAEAIAAVRVGDRAMFEALVRRYNERLYRVGMGFLEQRVDVEDAMQETYLQAYRNLGRFRGESSVGTWLTRIMINQCRMRLRRERRRRGRLEERPMEPFDEREPWAGPERDLNSEEIKRLLEQSIERLPSSYRAVYMLREVQNLSLAEVAESLDITPQNARVRLHRAREALKDILLEKAEEMELFSYPAPWCNPLSARVMGAIADL